MNETKTFRPASPIFIILGILLCLFLIGFLYLIIISFIQHNWFYIIISILGFSFLLYEVAKSILWKVVFKEDHIYVPSSVFDLYLFGKNNKIQKIYYSEIEELQLLVHTPQSILIKCRGESEPNIIYVKQFTRGQAYKMIDEINIRAQEHSETFIPFDVHVPRRKRVNKKSGIKRA